MANEGHACVTKLEVRLVQRELHLMWALTNINDIDKGIQIECERFSTYQAILTHCPSKGQKITTSSLLNCCQMGSVKRLLVVSNSWDIVVQNRQN